MADFALEQVVVVKWKDGKGTHTWNPNQQLVDDERFFEFSKWDRGFVKWVCGKSLDLRAQSIESTATADCKFMDRVIEIRQSVADEALHQALLPSEGEEEDGKRKKTKRRKRASQSDSHLCPKVLTMELPGVEEEGLQPRSVKVLFDGSGSASIWMEFNKDILMHLRAGVVHSDKNQRKSKASKKKD